MRVSRVHAACLALAAAWLAMVPASFVLAGQRALAIATENPAGGSLVQAYSMAGPWQPVSPPLPVDGQARLTWADGKLYALSRAEGTVAVIDPVAWATLETFDLGGGGIPVDLAVRGEAGYVTREGATHLLRLDLATGATSEPVDFSPLADADGIPDLGTMVFDGVRLLVQVRRQNENELEFFLRPAWIAIVDTGTDTLVDVDPALAGVQGIALQGTAPFFPMQVGPAPGRLFVSASMNTHNVEGGIEMIDLGSLTSLGIVAPEVDAEHFICCDMAPFVMVSPSRGYFTISTDSTLSLHLHTFTVEGGHDPRDLYTSVGFEAPRMVHDPGSDQLFVPVLEEGPGFHVFDAVSGGRVSATIVATQGLVQDLVAIQGPGGAPCVAGPQSPCPAIPAGTPWAWGALTALLAAVGLLRFRRRHAART